MVRDPWRLAAAVLVPLALAASGCASSQNRSDEAQTGAQQDEAATRQENTAGVTAYEAHLAPLNVTVAAGPTTGAVRLLQRGDEISIAIDVAGAPPGIVHIQHIHGFVDGKPATCASASSDTNDDGILDLAETEATSGTTLVPFHGDPTNLDIAGEGYPTADATGAYHYRATISASALEQALQQANGAALDLGNRVVYVHGVYEDAELPSTVASLPDVPAHVTLPIACGEIQRVTPAT